MFCKNVQLPSSFKWPKVNDDKVISKAPTRFRLVWLLTTNNLEHIRTYSSQDFENSFLVENILLNWNREQSLKREDSLNGKYPV